MRVRKRAAVALVAAAAPIALTTALAPPALAAGRPHGVAPRVDTRTSTAPVDTSAWFWRHATAQLGAPVDPVGDNEPSQVPSGDLAVAADAQGAPTKDTFLAFDLASVPDGATLQRFVVTVPLDRSVNQLSSAPPALRACAPKSSWPGGSGLDWASRPEVDCTHAAAGHFDAGAQAYRFDVRSFARGWLAGTGADGVAITAAPASGATQAPFQLALAGPTHVTASVTFTLPVAAAPGGTTLQPAGTGEADATGSSSAAASSAGDLPAVAGLVAGELPATASTSGDPGAAPVVAPSAGTVTPTRNVALGIPSGSPGVPAGFLLALLAAAGALVALAALLAEHTAEPAAVLARRRAAMAVAARGRR